MIGTAIAPDHAWRLILAVRAAPGTSQSVGGLTAHVAGGWSAARPVGREVAGLLDLYLPLAAAPAWVLGHLGQSLDGRIACESGHSHTINDAPNIDHMHRLRALADAVVVGASTVRADDPRLTTRRVAGESPVRVVVAGRGSLDADRTVFRDGAAPTLLVRTARGPEAPAGVEAVTVASTADGHADPVAVIAALRARGLARIFIEGGGRMVSAFLRAGVLDRLQICVAPLLIGSGVPALTLPPVDHLGDAIRPHGRWIPMGRDVLYDCVLERPPSAPSSRGPRRSSSTAPGSDDARIAAP